LGTELSVRGKTILLESREWSVACCRKMLLIRHFEEKLVELHNQGHFAGHYHAYIGQEATGVPAISCTGPQDTLFTTHRNHGHLLARGADPARMFAEILGRRDGGAKGKAGTFHLTAPELGFHHTSGIVAGIIPMATGAAYAAKVRGAGGIAVCLFGDGALEEGAAPEALNIASLWTLPILFLCENNGKYGAGKAVGAAQSPNMAAYPLIDLPKVYKIPAEQVDGTNVEAVYRAVSTTVGRIRNGAGPQFIEAHTVRWPGSESNWPVVPIVTSFELAWDISAVPDKVREWYRASDPVLIFIRQVVAAGTLSKQDIAEIEREVIGTIETAAEFAIASPFPDAREALTDVFA
jgi:pyruvate dehydrogenase E1 component alpha subunit